MLWVFKELPGTQTVMCCGCLKIYLVHKLWCVVGVYRTTWYTDCGVLWVFKELPGTQTVVCCGCLKNYLVHRLWCVVGV